MANLQSYLFSGLLINRDRSSGKIGVRGHLYVPRGMSGMCDVVGYRPVMTSQWWQVVEKQGYGLTYTSPYVVPWVLDIAPFSRLSPNVEAHFLQWAPSPRITPMGAYSNSVWSLKQNIILINPHYNIHCSGFSLSIIEMHMFSLLEISMNEWKVKDDVDN